MENNKLVKGLLVGVLIVLLGISFSLTNPGTAHASAKESTGSVKVIHLHYDPNSVTPYISPANCNTPNDWFIVWTSDGNVFCYGGGGYMAVRLTSVAQVSTGNNWGHFQVNNEASRRFFSYYQNYYFYNDIITGIWLYE